MRVDTQELKVAPKRDPKMRYRQFIKQTVERKLTWGLFLDGWALSRDESGQTLFPLWSEREFAERAAKGPWQGYEAAEIPLEDLLEQLLPQLARDALRPRLFADATDPGQAPPIAQLILDLEHEIDPNASEDDA